VVALFRRPVSSRVFGNATGDHSPWRAGATSNVGGFGLQSRRKARCQQGHWSFCELRGDATMPLICPTCQIFFRDRSKHPRQRHRATLHGVVFDIFWHAEP
jgi:hypothetical protein